MAESCVVDRDRSRKSQTAILQGLASTGQKTVGEAIGKSETWVSRWKSEDLTTCANLLAALNLKIVPAAHKCYSAEYVDNLRYFARIGMAVDDGSPPPEPLKWSDDE